ncbi:hypothetical protein KC332_g11456 [Hortaea werneckii]|nr:hypothetical protein KC361_g9010 [Hortaea werneckii]KAI6814784.1 hypothetical protein KC342_g16264 [Hortaea werneckii]KAI6853575.1 hypothetical protein KC323_g9290 [Hortaea werneckii]KAI6858055.1 hypothetical protein KC338_g7847 [Hortaea werneckii]KAI6996371.1 hypothetical protein KC329_g2045 [Hortaea werneckii]
MNPSQRTNDFSWMGSFIRQNTCVAQDTEWDPQGRTAATKAAEFGGLLEEGLCFSVLLWRVSEFIDLKEIQEKYRQPWTSLRSLKGRFRPNYGTLESATTFILHEVITYLRTHEEEDLANAILNSTSDWRWRGPDSSLGSAQVRRAGQFSTSPIYQEDLNDYWKSDIIESVAQVPLGLDADASRNMFLLDASTDRCPLQSWFVDRIMDKGGFWSGHPIRQTTNPWGFDSPHETDMVLLQIDPASNASGKAQVRNIYRPPDSPDAYMTHSAGAPPVSHGEALIQASRITKHSNRHLQCHTHCPDFDLREGDTGLRTRNTVQSVLMLTGLAEGKRLGDMTDRHKRRAIFDIDGDINGKIMVLSPLQMVLEAVPRSRLRGMSVSWVVEPAERDGESKIEDTYKFEAKGQVQGMWPFSIIPSGRYNLV